MPDHGADIKNTDFLENIPEIEIKPLPEGRSIAVISHTPKLTNLVKNGSLDGFLNKFTEVYRDIYGEKPWNEYLICTNQLCKKKSGIPLNETLQTADSKFHEHPENFKCESCHSPMDFFYPHKKTAANISLAFQQKIFASLLLNDQHELSGFHVGWQISVMQGHRDKMIIGDGDPSEAIITYEEYLRELQNILGRNYQEEDPAYNAAEWGVKRNLRGEKTSFSLLHAAFLRAQEKITSTQDIPVIAHTIKNSKALDLVKKINWATGPEREGTEEIRLYSTIPILLQGIETYISHK